MDLISCCQEKYHNIYIISTDKKLSNIKFDYENVRYINVYSEIKDLNYLDIEKLYERIPLSDFLLMRSFLNTYGDVFKYYSPVFQQ